MRVKLFMEFKLSTNTGRAGQKIKQQKTERQKDKLAEKLTIRYNTTICITRRRHLR